MKKLDAYARLLFPRIPTGYEGSAEQKKARQNVWEILSEGNVSAHLGRFKTIKDRNNQRARVYSSASD